MNVSCPNCNTTYRVDPAKVPETGVRARCAVCSAVFPVRREGAGVTQPAPARPAAVAAPPAPPPPKPPASPPSPEPQAVPAALAVPAAPPAPPRTPAVPARGQMPPAMPPGVGVRPPAFRPATPSRPAGAPAAPTGGPPPPPRPPVHAAPAPAPAPTPRPTPAPAASASPAPAAAPSPARPINPFLTQDPAAKARRLARALISDMVVYHPAKRQEGLRDGTLKQLFEEEIKKSWEEYADQVGKDVADSTPYFREALNDILADGKQLF